jgi:hypothetical protein
MRWRLRTALQTPSPHIAMSLTLAIKLIEAKDLIALDKSTQRPLG